VQPKTPKSKKCAVCKAEFTSHGGFVTWCGFDCGVVLATARLGKAKRKAAKEKKVEAVKDRKETKVKLAKMDTRGDWIRFAQQSFNAYIRERDKQAGHPCISSGRPLDWSGNAVDAGHFRSRGSAPHLRFDERNCHAQSKHDNRYASGNASGYRHGLIARIGLEALEALECDQTPRRHSIDDLKAIKAEYVLKLKQLKAKQ